MSSCGGTTEAGRGAQEQEMRRSDKQNFEKSPIFPSFITGFIVELAVGLTGVQVGRSGMSEGQPSSFCCICLLAVSGSLHLLSALSH